MSSTQFLVRSKPILPLHLQIPKQPRYTIGEMEYYTPQGYRPEPYPSSALYDIPSGASSQQPRSQMQHWFHSWPRSVDLRGYGDNGNLSTSQSAPQGLDANQPAAFPPSDRNLQNGSRTIYEGLARQPIRKRTAQACEKCRNRKTKCSGEHPACQRCAARGLICTYTGGRVRGPSKSRLRNVSCAHSSEPASATQSHFSFSSASPEDGNSGSSLSVESLYDLVRTATPMNFDTYSSSPASASLSSASSPSSSIWPANLDNFGLLEPTEMDIPSGSLLSQATTVPSIPDLLATDISPPTAGVADVPESLYEYLVSELFSGDTNFLVENSTINGASDADRKLSPSSSFMSQFVNADSQEVADGINWDNLLFPV